MRPRAGSATPAWVAVSAWAAAWRAAPTFTGAGAKTRWRARARGPVGVGAPAAWWVCSTARPAALPRDESNDSMRRRPGSTAVTVSRTTEEIPVIASPTAVFAPRNPSVTPFANRASPPPMPADAACVACCADELPPAGVPPTPAMFNGDAPWPVFMRLKISTSLTDSCWSVRMSPMSFPKDPVSAVAVTRISLLLLTAYPAERFSKMPGSSNDNSTSGGNSVTTASVWACLAWRLASARSSA
jgi:hypothetical protein